jgi:thiamine-monophosphate kinase
LGEFETIAWIKRLAEKVPSSAWVRVGIGDDCCVIAPDAGWELVLSTDAVVEGVHFRLDYFDCFQVGAKAMGSALSDLAAVAAEPVGALVTVSVDDKRPGAALESLARGLIDTGARYGCPLIGGDLTASPGPLIVNVTVIGRARCGCPVLRSGARPGDEIWVTGSPGDAAAVLACLEAGLRGEDGALPVPDRPTRDRLLCPTPRIREARLIYEAGPPGAMIDISDGLAADLGHILEASGVGALLDRGCLPASGFSRSVAQAIGLPPEHFLLHGGEDYELCFTVPPGLPAERIAGLEKTAEAALTRIGEITSERGVLALREPDGRVVPLSKSGYDHFSHNPDR